MPLKNIELRHGSRCDSWVWRIIIPADKKRAWRPKLCWVNKKPFTVGDVLYFYNMCLNFGTKAKIFVIIAERRSYEIYTFRRSYAED